jgi:hypothetical protein
MLYRLILGWLIIDVTRLGVLLSAEIDQRSAKNLVSHKLNATTLAREDFFACTKTKI